MMIDVSRIVPEAQSVIEQAAQVYIKHTKPWFIGLIAHGSAVKGGFIPGCSDIDLQLYLESSAFKSGHLPLKLSVSIHRDLARIDPAPFGYIQCYPLTDKLREDWTGPIPGAYALVAGRLPVPEATDEVLRASAQRRLSRLEPLPAHLHDNLLEHGAGRLERHVRLLCTEIWSTLYDLLALQQADPIWVWNLTKRDAMAVLHKGSILAQTIHRFYMAVLDYYPDQNSVEGALTVIESGVAFLHAAKSWWERHKSTDTT